MMGSELTSPDRSTRDRCHAQKEKRTLLEQSETITWSRSRHTHTTLKRVHHHPIRPLFPEKHLNFSWVPWCDFGSQIRFDHQSQGPRSQNPRWNDPTHEPIESRGRKSKSIFQLLAFTNTFLSGQHPNSIRLKQVYYPSSLDFHPQSPLLRRQQQQTSRTKTSTAALCVDYVDPVPDELASLTQQSSHHDKGCGVCGIFYIKKTGLDGSPRDHQAAYTHPTDSQPSTSSCSQARHTD